MDKRIRRNELCVIGLPKCDYVFSSTRSCFIGYGFGESSLEMSILRHLLSDRGIEPVEAGGTVAPAQNAWAVLSLRSEGDIRQNSPSVQL